MTKTDSEALIFGRSRAPPWPDVIEYVAVASACLFLITDFIGNNSPNSTRSTTRAHANGQGGGGVETPPGRNFVFGLDTRPSIPAEDADFLASPTTSYFP
jgi:hypothetical protein